MANTEAVKSAMRETRAGVEAIGYFDGALKCSWAEIAVDYGFDPIAAFWALRRMLGSDEQEYDGRN